LIFDWSTLTINQILPVGDFIDNSWLTELVTCAFKAEELASHTTSALFLEATPTPNSHVKTAATEHIANWDDFWLHQQLNLPQPTAPTARKRWCRAHFKSY
jgi:hypothetical protein